MLEQLAKLGEKDIEIIDIDLNYGPSSISVELLTKPMVDKLKLLDGTVCLGATLKVRRVNEETSQSNAQAAAIALAAFKSLSTATSKPDAASIN